MLGIRCGVHERRIGGRRARAAQASQDKTRARSNRTCWPTPSCSPPTILGVEDDLRTLPQRLMEGIEALSVSRGCEP